MNRRERDENDRWLAHFERAHGRRLRVLHIGNVANNAYLNAKILNARGVDCDVVSADYYHIMACPEWEDADFRGDVADQFYPNWEAVDLQGFRRPPWFAQGPMRYCIAYLTAKRLGRRLTTSLNWTYLRARRWYTCSSRLRGVRNTVERIRGGWIGRTIRRMKRWAVWARCAAGAVVQRIARTGQQGVSDEYPASSTQPPALHTPYSVLGTQYSFDRRMEELIAAFAEFFPGRADRLTSPDLVRNRLATGWWRRLLRHYDVVVGYAIESKWPLLAGTRPYFAYEHGTIRNIPFEDNEQGRVCAIAYRAADGEFITNCDNVHSAERLGLENYRFIPHPVNEDLGGDRELSERLRAELRARLDSDFVVFHPPRQHWEPRRHPDWEKGNDIFLRGFARFTREVNPRAGVVLVEWGQTIQASKDLLASLGVADRVLWIPPQPNVAMIRYIQACDLLADQFFLGAFGSTMPKALLHGCPAMLYLDEDRHHWCFPEMPPVINARTPEQVFDGLARLYRDPDYAEDLVRRGRKWYAKYHSNEVIAETFLQAFREALSLECGDSSPLSSSAPATPVPTLSSIPIQSGIKPPHSKVGAGR
jgi:glycosyltransferase involved in cell wall biosynthesis